MEITAVWSSIFKYALSSIFVIQAPLNNLFGRLRQVCVSPQGTFNKFRANEGFRAIVFDDEGLQARQSDCNCSCTQSRCILQWHLQEKHVLGFRQSRCILQWHLQEKHVFQPRQMRENIKKIILNIKLAYL
jgi:hypothetical protein